MIYQLDTTVNTNYTLICQIFLQTPFSELGWIHLLKEIFKVLYIHYLKFTYDCI